MTDYHKKYLKYKKKYLLQKIRLYGGDEERFIINYKIDEEKKQIYFQGDLTNTAKEILVKKLNQEYFKIQRNSFREMSETEIKSELIKTYANFEIYQSNPKPSNLRDIEKVNYNFLKLVEDVVGIRFFNPKGEIDLINIYNKKKINLIPELKSKLLGNKDSELQTFLLVRNYYIEKIIKIITETIKKKIPIYI